MKILHLLAQHPAKTGSGTSLQKTIEYMDHEANEQFALYGLNANQEEVDVGCPSKAVVFSLEEDGQWLFGMSDAMPYPTNTYESMTDDQYDVWKNKWDRVIIDTLEDFQPDIIICHHLYLLLERVLQHALVPVVCVCHGTDIDQLAKNPKHRAIVRDVSQDIAMVFTNGPAQNEPIQNLLGIDADRLQIFGGGYDETYFYPPKKPKELPPVQLVFTGKISEHKGMRPLFYALEKVMKEIPLHLTIIGSGVGEEAEDLIALGESLQIPITYRGHLAQEDIGLLYHDMHILILPSYAEGLSLVVLEALGAGLRVVATDIENLMAFLPDPFVEKGIIEFVERTSHHILEENDPRFTTFVNNLEAKVHLQAQRWLEKGTQSYIIDMKKIQWSFRVESMEKTLAAIVQREKERSN